jgi:hypothetical protein
VVFAERPLTSKAFVVIKAASNREMAEARTRFFNAQPCHESILEAVHAN